MPSMASTVRVQDVSTSTPRALRSFRSSLGKALEVRPASRPRHSGRSAALGVESNLFSRIARIGKSYANSLVSSAEDPEKLLDQAVEDMQNDLIKLRQAAAEVTASQKRLENQYEAAQKSADEWYRRAELALTKGEEELAREALTRKKANQDNANTLKAQLELQSKAVETIISNMRTLEAKLQEAKMKKDTLKARAQSAKSAAAINDMVAGLGTSSALAAFEKMEDKVLAMEAQAEAALQLGPGAGSTSLEAKFKELEGNDVDDELSKMKALLGERKPVAQLPEGRS